MIDVLVTLRLATDFVDIDHLTGMIEHRLKDLSHFVAINIDGWEQTNPEASYDTEEVQLQAS